MLYVKPNQLKIQSIYYTKTCKNNIIDRAHFTRFVYSTSCVSLNALYITIPLHNVTYIPTEEKFRLEYDLEENDFEWIQHWECQMLEKKQSGKIIQHKVYDCLCYKTILLPQPKELVLKISGIWETDRHIGLSFKFIPKESTDNSP